MALKSKAKPKRKIGDKRKNNLPNGGNGRPRGAKNKVTADLKALIQRVTDELQEKEDTALKSWAILNLTDFYTKVMVKIIPKDVDLNLNIGDSLEKRLINAHKRTQK